MQPKTFFGDDIVPLQQELQTWWNENRKWWEDPVVTCLTDDEFHARFA
jgi:hypothetical protein